MDQNIQEPIVKSAQSASSSSFFMTLAISLLIIIITSLIYHKDSILNRTPPTYLILGPKNSGKTNLFELLTSEDNKLPTLTVSSMEPNEGELKLGRDHSRPSVFRVIDFPGNEKLKSLFLFPFLKESKNIYSLKGIIYLIDSAQFSNEYCNLVAKDLIALLPYTESVPNGIDFGIFCNKSDLFTSKKPAKIREMLTNEVTKLHKISLKNLNEISGGQSGLNDENNEESENTNSLKENLVASFENGEFKFELLEGNFDFLEGNFFKGKMDSLSSWIDEKAYN